MSSKVDIKVVLLGKESVGKTSLVTRFVYQEFGENKYKATLGALCTQNTVHINGKPITLAIWDTAGSERYQSMSSTYYNNARAAILCFDLTDSDSFNRLNFWINQLETNAKTCKIYLCGTKRDLIEDNAELRSVEAQKIFNYAKALNAKHYETSSKTGVAVNELFTQIAKDCVENKKSNETSVYFGPASKNRLNFEEPRSEESTCCGCNII